LREAPQAGGDALEAGGGMVDAGEDRSQGGCRLWLFSRGDNSG